MDNKNIKNIKVNKIKFFSTDNPMFLECKFYLMSEGENKNGSSFTLNSLQKAVSKIANKPILAAFDKYKINADGSIGDFTHHISEVKYNPKSGEAYNDYTGFGSERPVGLFPESTNVSIEKYNSKNFLIANGLIWVEYFKQGVDLLKKRFTNKVSVEIEVIESYFEEDIEIITDFEFLGVTLLGQDVEEGIEYAHLDILGFEKSEEFLKFKKEFSMAFIGEPNLENLNKREFLSPDKLGTENALRVDKSSKSISESAWGDVDKSLLKQRCLKAKNYRSIIPDIFLKLEEGWKDGKEGSLGYPVMQIKNDTLVYNRYGLSSALAYAEKNNETMVIAKIHLIYKKLGIDKPKEKENSLKMSKKFEIVLDKYKLFTILGKYAILFCDDGKMYAHPIPEDKEEYSEDKMLEMELVADCKEEKLNMNETFTSFIADFEAEKCSMEAEKIEMSCKMENDAQKFEEEKKEFETKLEDYESKKNEYAEMCKNFEKAKDDFAKLTEEYEVIKMSAFSAEAKQVMEDDPDLDEDDKANFSKKISERSYVNMEAFERDLAYCKYKKACEVKKMEKKETIQYSLDNKSKPESTAKKDLFDIAYEAVNRAVAK